MASYEIGSQTISSLTAAPNDILRLTATNHNGQQQLLGGGGIMDGFDHDLNFEGEGSMLYVLYFARLPDLQAIVNI